MVEEEGEGEKENVCDLVLMDERWVDDGTDTEYGGMSPDEQSMADDSVVTITTVFTGSLEQSICCSSLPTASGLLLFGREFCACRDI